MCKGCEKVQEACEIDAWKYLMELYKVTPEDVVHATVTRTLNNLYRNRLNCLGVLKNLTEEKFGNYKGVGKKQLEVFWIINKGYKGFPRQYFAG